jgi:hypothetical protein
MGTTLAGWGWDEDCVAAAVLVLSEILTNAQVHTDGDVVLILRRTGRGVRLSVTDTDARMPTRRDTGPEHEGGFGLHILDTITTGWGVRRRRGGKTVWADLDVPCPAARRHLRPVRARAGAASIRAALRPIRRAAPAGWAAARRGARPPRSQVWARRRVGAVATSARAWKRAWAPAARQYMRRLRRMQRGGSRLMLMDVLAGL